MGKFISLLIIAWLIAILIIVRRGHIKGPQAKKIKDFLESSRVSNVMFVVFIIMIIAIFIGAFVSKHNETERQRAIVNEVRTLIENCKKIKDNPITIRGRCLVWDVATDSRSYTYYKLPVKLQASSSDSQITVFMVLPERNVLVGYYSISRQPAYRQYMDVCVVHWPEKKAVGMYSIVSKEPLISRQVRNSPEYGDPNEPIARWIESLPRS